MKSSIRNEPYLVDRNAFEICRMSYEQQFDAVYIPIRRRRDPDIAFRLQHLLIDTKIYLLCSENSVQKGRNKFELLDWTKHSPFEQRPVSLSKKFRTTNKNWDLGRKRTATLNHARSNEYDNILLVDDDIVLYNPVPLIAISNALRKNPICSAISVNSPDRSVFGHIAASAFRSRAIMPSASFLGINVPKVTGIFPNNYNEDWFFFLQNRKNPPVIASSVFQNDRELFAEGEIVEQEKYDLIAEAALTEAFSGRFDRLFFTEYWVERKAERLNALLKLQSAIVGSSQNRQFDRILKLMIDELRSIDANDCCEYLRWLDLND